MDEQMTKERMLALIREERGALEQKVEALGEAALTRPGSADDWSLKDVLVHITAWEQLMIRWLEETLRGETAQQPDSNEGIDRVNAQIYLEGRSRPGEEVRAEFERSGREALAAVQAVEEDDLLDPDRYAWREGSPLWHMIAANTWWHYEEHREMIDDLLRKDA